MDERGLPRKRSIVFVAIIVSIILYFAGVFSGLYANKMIKEETRQDISILRQLTEKELDALQSYVNFLDTNLKSMQLEQTFTETLNQRQMCDFLEISLEELVKQLRYYWAKLPFRIEEYERYNKPSHEYLVLKQQYTHLSIRTWLLAKKQYDKCNMDIVHGLYFYSADCEKCVEQGEQIDKLSKMILDTGRNMIMFPIDLNSNETIIQNLKKYYSINYTPAIIINDRVFQGKLIKADQLMPKFEQNGQQNTTKA